MEIIEVTESNKTQLEELFGDLKSARVIVYKWFNLPSYSTSSYFQAYLELEEVPSEEQMEAIELALNCQVGNYLNEMNS